MPPSRSLRSFGRCRCPSPDFAVERVGETWFSASTSTYAKLTTEHPGARGQQLAALFFAHELIHHAQGLFAKDSVVELRRHGSEMLVMDLDLVADAIAVEWVSALGRVGWTRATLREATLRGFESFPASMSHTQASIERKSLRIACQMLTTLLGRDEYGFVWLELPAMDGNASIWWSHPDKQQIGSAEVSAATTRSLRSLALASGHRGIEYDVVERMCRDLLVKTCLLP